jgi:hypothetical protein
MAGSFERIAGAKEENTIFGSITRFWESPLRHLLVKEEAPQYLKTIRAILSSDEIINPTPNQVAGFRSHATDPDCEPGEHWMEEEDRYSISTLERVTNAGLKGSATDDGEARGVHVKRNGVGAGVEKTMSISARGEASTGKPRTGKIESKISVLYHEDMIYYSVTDRPMLKKMVELQVFNSEETAKKKMPMLKKYAEEEGKIDSNQEQEGDQGKTSCHIEEPAVAACHQISKFGCLLVRFLRMVT